MFFFFIYLFFLYLFFFLMIWLFFFNDAATTEIYTLSLHDARPISILDCAAPSCAGCGTEQSQPKDRAPMSIDTCGSLQHRRFGFHADHSQAAHAAVLCAGFSQGTQIGSERRCGAAQCAVLHIRLTPSLDV